MALAGDETYGTVVPGFVTDADGNLSVTTDTGSVQWREGFLRDLDGRLVVAEAGGIMQDGFIRTAGGALCVTTGSVTQTGTKIPGFPTNDDGLICVANDGTPANGLYPGFKFDGGKLCVTGLGGGPTPGVLFEDDFSSLDWSPDGTEPLATVMSLSGGELRTIYDTSIWEDNATITSPVFAATEVDAVTFTARRVGSVSSPAVLLFCLNGDFDLVGSLQADFGVNIPALETTNTAYEWNPTPLAIGAVLCVLGIQAGVSSPPGVEIWIDDVLVEGTA